jgi:hypothetical protein
MNMEQSTPRNKDAGDFDTLVDAVALKVPFAEQLRTHAL